MADNAPSSATHSRAPSSLSPSLLEPTRRTVPLCLAIGQSALEMKAQLNHGEFLRELESMGISYRLAQRCMEAATVLGDYFLTPLVKAIPTQSHMDELMCLDGAELEALASGKHVGALTLETLPTMSSAEVRSSIRNARLQQPAEGTAEPTITGDVARNGEAMPTEDIRSNRATSHDLGRRVALPANAPISTHLQLERRKAYCRELARVLVRYATADEVGALAEQLESQVRAITRSRPSQGLNDAAYAAFTRYMLA